MKIALAQIQSFKGSLERTIAVHLAFIQKAIAEKADLILFPELSLTAYEPTLAKECALSIDDFRLNIFQELSEEHSIVICVGCPSKGDKLPKISLFIFQPLAPRCQYDKQLLHADELPYFEPGNSEVYFEVKGKKIAPAICYESMQVEHNKQALDAKADLYLVSVAKTKEGMQQAHAHFSRLSKAHKMAIAVCNSLGFCDGFQSSGSSACWNKNGELVGSLQSNQSNCPVFYIST
jgi:predicted amidohydrolase